MLWSPPFAEAITLPSTDLSHWPEIQLERHSAWNGIPPSIYFFFWLLPSPFICWSLLFSILIIGLGAWFSKDFPQHHSFSTYVPISNPQLQKVFIPRRLNSISVHPKFLFPQLRVCLFKFFDGRSHPPYRHNYRLDVLQWAPTGLPKSPPSYEVATPSLFCEGQTFKWSSLLLFCPVP